MDIAQLGLEIRSDGVVVAKDRLRDFEGQADRTEKATGGLNMGFLALAAAAAAVTGALVLGVRGAINHADAISKMSQRVGTSVERLSALEHAAKLSGVGLDGMATSLSYLNRNMNEFSRGATNNAVKSLDQLGIKVTDANGALRDNLDVMADVADAFAGMEDGALKTAVAMDIFGRGGGQMIPLLNAGAAGLHEMMQEAERLGLVLDTKTAQAAERFNDNLTRLQSGGQGLFNTLMAAMLPALVAVTDALVTIAVNSGPVIDGLIEIARYGAVVGAALAGFFAPAMLAGLGALTVAIGTGLVGAIHAVTLAMMANPLGLLIAGIAAAVTAAFIFRDEIKQILGVDVVDAARDAGNRIIGIFEASYNAVVTLWQNLPQVFSGIGKMAWNSFIEEFEKPALTWGDNVIIPGFDLSGMKAQVTEGEMAALSASVASFSDTLNINRNYLGEWGTAIGDALTGADAAREKFDALEASLGGGGEGGGVSGALKAANDNLEQFSAAMQLVNGQESTFERLAADMAVLDDALAKGAISWEQYGQAAFRANSIAASSVLGLASGMTGALAQMFQDNKAFAVANAVVSTAEAVMKALSIYGPTPWGFAAAGVAAATGAAQIAAILSANKGGSSRPSVGGGAVSPQPVQQPQEQRVFNVTLAGSGYSRDDIRNLIEQLNEGMGEGITLNVNGAAA